MVFRALPSYFILFVVTIQYNMLSVFRVSTLDAFDQDGESSTGPYTPQLGSVSDAGDSIQDPGSVPVSDIMSPPSVGMRPPTSRPPKKK